MKIRHIGILAVIFVFSASCAMETNSSSSRPPLDSQQIPNIARINTVDIPAEDLVQGAYVSTSLYYHSSNQLMNQISAGMVIRFRLDNTKETNTTNGYLRTGYMVVREINDSALKADLVVYDGQGKKIRNELDVVFRAGETNSLDSTGKPHILFTPVASGWRKGFAGGFLLKFLSSQQGGDRALQMTSKDDFPNAVFPAGLVGINLGGSVIWSLEGLLPVNENTNTIVLSALSAPDVSIGDRILDYRTGLMRKVTGVDTNTSDYFVLRTIVPESQSPFELVYLKYKGRAEDIQSYTQRADSPRKKTRENKSLVNSTVGVNIFNTPSLKVDITNQLVMNLLVDQEISTYFIGVQGHVYAEISLSESMMFYVHINMYDTWNQKANIVAINIPFGVIPVSVRLAINAGAEVSSRLNGYFSTGFGMETTFGAGMDFKIDATTFSATPRSTSSFRFYTHPLNLQIDGSMTLRPYLEFSPGISAAGIACLSLPFQVYSIIDLKGKATYLPGQTESGNFSIDVDVGCKLSGELYAGVDIFGVNLSKTWSLGTIFDKKERVWSWSWKHVPPVVIPDTPTGLIAVSNGDGSINLRWNRVLRAVGYNLFRHVSTAPTNEWICIPVKETNFTDTLSLSANTTCSYKVSAYDVINESPLSAVVSTTIPAPLPPASIAVTPTGEGPLSIRWPYTETNAEYELEKSYTNSLSQLVCGYLGTQKETNFTDSNVVKGVTYSYRVRAVKRVGVSSFSAWASGSVIAPAYPSGLRTNSISPMGIGLAWDAVSNSVLYFLEIRRTNTSNSPVVLRLSNLVWFDSNAITGVTNHYRIYSSNLCAASSVSPFQSAFIPVPITPSYITVTPTGAGPISIFWPFTEASATYQLEKRYTNALSQLVLTQLLNSAATNYVDSNVAKGVSYSYRVRAVKVRGESGYTSWVSGSVVVPAYPTGLTATSISPVGIELSWNAVTNSIMYFLEIRRTNAGNPAVTLSLTNLTWFDSNALTGVTNYYLIYSSNLYASGAFSPSYSASIPVPITPSYITVKPTGEGPLNIFWPFTEASASYLLEKSYTNALSQLVQTQFNMAAATNYSDSNVAKGINYSYRVKAFKVKGESLYTAWVAGSVVAPAAPSGLAVTSMTPYGIGLSWDAVTNAIRYYLEIRRTNAGGTPVIVSTTENSWYDTNIIAGITNYYRAFASNLNASGAFSATVSRVLPVVTNGAGGTNASLSSLYFGPFYQLKGITPGGVTNATNVRVSVDGGAPQAASISDSNWQINLSNGVGNHDIRVLFNYDTGTYTETNQFQILIPLNYLYQSKLVGTFGPSSKLEPNSLYADSTGNIYLEGWNNNASPNLGAVWGVSDPKSYYAAFYLRMDTNGFYQGSSSIDSQPGDQFWNYRMALKSDGNSVLLMPQFSGFYDWNTNYSPTGSSGFLFVKPDGTGDQLVEIVSTNVANLTYMDGAFDPAGNLYVSGSFYSDGVNFGYSFGSNEYIVSPDPYDPTYTYQVSSGFLMKVTADRKFGGITAFPASWTNSFEYDKKGIFCSASGTLYLYSQYNKSFQPGATWGNNSIVPLNADVAEYLLVFDVNSGMAIRDVKWFPTGVFSACRMTEDKNGSVYFGGQYMAPGSVNLAEAWGQTVNRSGITETNTFICKMFGSSYQWMHTLPGNCGTYQFITADAYSNVYVTGMFSGAKNFGESWGIQDEKTSTNGSTDIFVTCIHSDGSYGWTAIFQGESEDLRPALVYTPKYPSQPSKTDGYLTLCARFGAFSSDWDPSDGVDDFGLVGDGSRKLIISRLEVQ